MQFFDTHAHLDDEAFGGALQSIIDRAREANVRRITAIGTSAASSQAVVDLAERFPDVWAAVGIQPNETAGAGTSDWQRIVALSQHERVVALGETGVDHHWDFAPLETQLRWFRRHVELALEQDRPMVIHLREGKHGQAADSCFRDIVRVLRETAAGAPLRGIMHSFTGTREQAAEAVELGLHLSFAGMVTFKKSEALRSVAASVPPHRLLIETDAPYLTPHPHRGRYPNEPACVVHTAACLADVRGTSLAGLAQQTWDNACRLFGLRCGEEDE